MKLSLCVFGLLGGLFLLGRFLDDNDHNYERTHYGQGH